MSPQANNLLARLCACDPGMGCLLYQHEKRYAGPLVQAGFADWIQAAGVRVYRATKEGRAYAAKAETEKK